MGLEHMIASGPGGAANRATDTPIVTALLVSDFALAAASRAVLRYLGVVLLVHAVLLDGGQHA